LRGSEITVASLNVQRLFDTIDEPGKSDVVLTPAAFQQRVIRLARYVRRMLRSPDILGVEEVENLSTLEAVATAINGEATAAGEGNPGYRAYLEPSNDPSGIAVGVLVKRSRIEVLDHHQEGRDATFFNPATRTQDLLNDRPPFVLSVRGPGYLGRGPVLTVIVNHLRSLTDIESPTDGARVRAKRAAQAEFLADLIQQRQRENPFERLIVVGDMNAFDVNDGLVDVIGTIRGNPALPDFVVQATVDRFDPDLVSVTGRLPANERYSYVFDGSAQTLDHALVSSALVPDVTGVAYGRGNADAPEVWRSDPRRFGRVSDHDGVLIYLRLGSR
jgi:predicted extracellular nuclease